jgi:hypothetical protein
VANAFISFFNTQPMHIKSFDTHCYVSVKTLYRGGIRTRVFSFLRRMRCPLRHAASLYVQFNAFFQHNQYCQLYKNKKATTLPISWRDSISRPITPQAETMPQCRPRRLGIKKQSFALVAPWSSYLPVELKLQVRIRPGCT